VNRTKQSGFIGMVVNRDELNVDLFRLQENRSPADDQFAHPAGPETTSAYHRIEYSPFALGDS
jgi:hypothetical protein